MFADKMEDLTELKTLLKPIIGQVSTPEASRAMFLLKRMELELADDKDGLLALYKVTVDGLYKFAADLDKQVRTLAQENQELRHSIDTTVNESVARWLSTKNGSN
jgi:hypothetical protein